MREVGIDVSVVMPVVVHTELGSGLAEARGFKAVEPEDVAAAIMEALQTGRYEVFVPRSLASILRPKGMLPVRALDAVTRFLKSDQILMTPDRALRAAYDARLAAGRKRPLAPGANSESVSDAAPPVTEEPVAR
jgi:hypothetical protein